MRLVLHSLVVFGSLLAVTGCAARKTFQNKSITVAQTEAATLRVNWVKDKGRKYDIELVLANQLAAPIVIRPGDIRCSRGSADGELKYASVEGAIVLGPEETRMFHMVCRTGPRASGPYQIEIARLFSKGKVVGASIGWTGQD